MIVGYTVAIASSTRQTQTSMIESFFCKLKQEEEREGERERERKKERKKVREGVRENES